MLTKRVNILFEERAWARIQKKAKRLHRSTSDLIREAVERFDDDKIAKARKEAYESIVKNRPKPSKKPIDYKALINGGRNL